MRFTTNKTPILVGLLLLASCAHRSATPADPSIPEPPREFRAAWIATVANIDWPSKPGLSTEIQKREATAMLDRLVELNMNAVILQVRPHGDALYDSAIEPWSSYLTGKQGRAPEPFYDPLEFWIAESHARGIQLHAWLNPYRADHPSNKGGIDPSHIAARMPEAVPALKGSGYRWMDPSVEAVQNQTLAVVADLLHRYDLDGIHFDDYFYPYPSYNNDEEFPDQANYDRYLAGGGTLNRSDWRRSHVDQLIRRLYEGIKAIKPHVEFGISPFGIWRPGYPESIQGFDQHESLYADARLWLREGWIDYFMPQLYWPIGKVPQSFPVLLGWWSEQNRYQRHLWPGTSVARLKGDPGATELVNQIMVTRGMEPQSPGLCLFSMKWIMDRENPLAQALVVGPYAAQALIPASPWLLEEDLETPTGELFSTANGLTMTFNSSDGRDPFLWLIRYRTRDRWHHVLLKGSDRGWNLPIAEEALSALVLTPVHRTRCLGQTLRLR
jgi:uncharacterized lipoprotein YddW (UPF0748 family)